MLYMQVCNEYEAERAVKRLRTRIAIAENAESSLAKKQAHCRLPSICQKDHINTAYRFKGPPRFPECNGIVGERLMGYTKQELDHLTADALRRVRMGGGGLRHITTRAHAISNNRVLVPHFPPNDCMMRSQMNRRQ